MLIIASFVLASVSLLAAHTPTVAADAWSDQVLTEHNRARARYAARPLQWNPLLYPGTMQYAQMCRYAHSDAKWQYGENLYASSDPNTGIANAVKAWMDESSKYNYNQPQFSPATDCHAGTVSPQATKYIVCRYNPPGNIPGQFPLNVGRPV
ncbi:unnamed protein product [Mortierella alpina]